MAKQGNPKIEPATSGSQPASNRLNSYRRIPARSAWVCLALVAAGCCWGAISSAKAQPDTAKQTAKQLNSVAWSTGDQLEQKLSAALSITFSGVPLRAELTKFAQREGIGLVIDRRVDPGTSISFNQANLTFEQVLWKLAAENNLGVCQLGEIYYLGPPDTARALPLLWHELKTETAKLKRRSKAKWDLPGAVHWPQLNQPAETLDQLSQKYGFRVLPLVSTSRADVNQADQDPAPRIPHDVWPEIALPNLRLDEQVGLLLLGFGLWFERSADGSEMQLIAFPVKDKGQLEWRGPEEIRKLIPGLKQRFPQAQFSLKKSLLSVKGEADDLAAATAWLVSQRSAKQGTAQTYSLKTLATRQQILSSVCARKYRLEFAPDLARIMDERVELSVENVDLDELIRQVLKGTELKYQLKNERLLLSK